MPKLSSLNFYPHDPSSILRDQQMKIKILNLTVFFIEQTIEAVHSFFIKKTYADFDAHVGDTLCQIRAYKLLLMIKYFEENPCENYYPTELANLAIAKNKIKEKLAEFQNLIANKNGKYDKVLDKPETLEQFIKNHRLEFRLTETTWYLSQCIILTKYSKRVSFGVSVAMEHSSLIHDTGSSLSGIKRIIRNFQTSIAAVSCDFIYSLSKEVPILEKSRKDLKIFERTDSHKRRILPTYEATKIILSHIKAQNIPILLVTNRKTDNFIFEAKPFLFDFSKEKNQFELLHNLSSVSPKTRCLIIHGTTKSITVDPILKTSLEHVILSNMATHPQLYPETFEDMDRLNEELSNMKSLAITHGYCEENPTLFFLKHIYADSLQNELLRIANHNHSTSYSLSV